MNELTVEMNAELHYNYVESICHKMYVDAFIHGYKHGMNDNEIINKKV